jgi:hypothetical protein
MSFRPLFKGAYGPLVALCALVVVLWVGSYRSIADVRLPVTAGSTRWVFTSYRGVLSISLAENFPTTESATFAARHDDSDLAGLADDRYYTGALAGLGFEDTQVWLRDADGELVVRHFTALNLPYWLPLCILLLGPLHCVYVILRGHRRTTHNQCSACGYDLGDGEMCQACAARATLIGASSRMHLVR